ncbi:hypothetical protein EDB19DRAFT_2045264 [Suillus lakei]|nr:hypothetical protein EDB19DRAFT_2045264 [Suillus lakei]
MAQREDENVAHKRATQQGQRSQGMCPSVLSRPPRPSSPESSDISSVVTTRHKRQITPDSEPTDKPAKSPRTDGPALRKHERFWLPDGNTVIELDGICFRVHQSWIVKHSKRIAAMLTNQGKQDGRFEEITVDFHAGLKALDFEALLSFYENPGDYRDYIETPTLMSLIRAATVLDFDSDRVWLVAALARMCDIDALLKPAFYDMARAPGFGLDKLEESEQISRANVLRLVRMREYLSAMWSQVAAHEDPTLIFQNFLDASSNGEGSSSLFENAEEKPALCPTASASMDSNCLLATARRDGWVRLAHYSEIFTPYRYDPLRGLAALTNIEWTDDRCKDCKEKRKAGWHTMQRRIWETVGEYLREE